MFTSADFLSYSISSKVKNEKYIEMSNFESAYLAGLIKKFRPKSVIEVGVAAGGTSALILTAFKEFNLDSHLTSIDINPLYYRNRSLPTGFVTKADFPDNKNWNLITGKYLPQVAREFKDKFDMVIIDSVHSLPGEIVDLLVILPLIRRGGVIIFHDTHLHLRSWKGRRQYATKIAYSVCVGDKFYCKDESAPYSLPNIAAFQVTDDTFKYLDNVFAALSMCWEFVFKPEIFEAYYNYYKDNYPLEKADYFKLAYEANKKLFELKDAE